MEAYLGMPSQAEWKQAQQEIAWLFLVVEKVWKYSLVIESAVRRGDGPDQYRGVVNALALVKQAHDRIPLDPSTPPSHLVGREWGDDWTVDDTDTAREILLYLGIGDDASREPGADRRRDRVAQIIRARIDVAAQSPAEHLVAADIPLLADLQRHVDEVGHTEIGQNIAAAIEVIDTLVSKIADWQKLGAQAESQLEESGKLMEQSEAEIWALREKIDRLSAPVDQMVAGVATVSDHNAAYDPADDAFGGAFKDGFREGWLFAKDPRFEDREEIEADYSREVDIAPSECWDAYKETYFAMLPLAAIPEVGDPMPTPLDLVLGSEAREIIARFFAEEAASSPMSGGLTADDYMGCGGQHKKADELMERLAALSAPEAQG